MPIYRLDDRVPKIHDDAWIHPDAVLIGAVEVGAQASIWPGAVLRGDFGVISVGARTSIQDGTVVHAGAAWPTMIGEDCVVGHNVHLEGCTVGDAVLLGSSSVVLKATVDTGGSVAAGAVVLDGMHVPEGMRAQGVPAKLVASELTGDWVRAGAQSYISLSTRYGNGLVQIDRHGRDVADVNHP